MKALFFSLCLVFPSLSVAASIELTFKGSITTTFADAGVTSPFSSGDLWTATFTYSHPHPADSIAFEVAQWFVSGLVGFKASIYQYASTNFRVTTEPPVVAKFEGVTQQVGGPPASTLFFRATFTSHSPLIQSRSLPASFSDWDFPSTETFRMDVAGQGWSWTSNTLLSSSIRQIPEPVGTIWVAAGLWWAARRRGSCR